MRSCLRIPRIFIPREGNTEWSVIACDRYASDRAYWERVERSVGESPSTLHFILPEVFQNEADEARIKLIREKMYTALEEEWIVKLLRGFVLTERSLAVGARWGIVAAIDLEAYSDSHGSDALIRPAQEIDRARMQAYLEQRKNAPLEFPHAVVLYRDKRDKVVRGILKEDLERLYAYELMEGGGRVRGLFVPDDIARDAALELQSRSGFFAVAEGGDCVAAAKAHWEALKETLPEAERESHPARLMLVELQNICADAVEIHPVHRAVKDIEPEAFCDFLSRNIKCKRKGNVVYAELPTNASNVQKIDRLIERFVRANTGRIEYVRGERALLTLAQEENCAGVVLKPLDKDDFFDEIENGKRYPKRAFTLGKARYYVEGREISYD